MAITPENYWPLGSTIQKTFTDMSATDTRDHGILSVNTTNGHMVLIYRLGAFDGGGIYIRHSSDGGATWSSEAALLPYFGSYYLTISGGYSSTGRLFLFYTKYDARRDTLTMNYKYSDNDGSSWSSEQTLSTTPNTQFGAYGHIVDVGNPNHNPSNNTLYQTWYGVNGSTYSLNLYKSTNNGTSFSSVIQIYSGTDQLSEPSMVNLGGGCFLVLAKINNGTTFRQFNTQNNFTSWSSDGNTDFETLSQNPASVWLSFINYNGVGIVACYYIDRDSTPYKLKVVFGLAEDLLTDGIDGWNDSTIEEVDLDSESTSGYQSFFHPLNQFKGIGNTFVYGGSPSSRYPKIVFTPEDDMISLLETLGL